MIKKNHSLVLTVLEKQPSGLEEIYRVESLPDRTKMMIRSPGNALIVISDVTELEEAIVLMKQFGKDNPTETVKVESTEGTLDMPMIVEFGLKE